MTTALIVRLVAIEYQLNDEAISQKHTNKLPPNNVIDPELPLMPCVFPHALKLVRYGSFNSLKYAQQY
jgi:hypothetical protein